MLLADVDSELCTHLKGSGIRPGQQVVWPLISGFLAASLPFKQWCQLWDELLSSRAPIHLLCAGVALAQAMRHALISAAAAPDAPVQLERGMLLQTPLTTLDVRGLIAASRALSHRAACLKLHLRPAARALALDPAQAAHIFDGGAGGSGAVLRVRDGGEEYASYLCYPHDRFRRHGAAELHLRKVEEWLRTASDKEEEIEGMFVEVLVKHSEDKSKQDALMSASAATAQHAQDLAIQECKLLTDNAASQALRRLRATHHLASAASRCDSVRAAGGRPLSRRKLQEHPCVSSRLASRLVPRLHAVLGRSLLCRSEVAHLACGCTQRAGGRLRRGEEAARGEAGARAAVCPSARRAARPSSRHSRRGGESLESFGSLESLRCRAARTGKASEHGVKGPRRTIPATLLVAVASRARS